MSIEILRYKLTNKDKKLVLVLEKIIRGMISSVMGDKYVESDGEKLFYKSASSLYC